MNFALSVVVAAYDEVDNVGELVDRLCATLAALEGVESEIVFVVEGSDGTREVLEELSAGIPSLRVLYREKQLGIGAAFRCGFEALDPGRNVVVTMDADLNHRPEEIPNLLEALNREDADIVVGSRWVAGAESYGIPLWKRLLSRTVNHVMRLMFGLRVRDKTSGFRIYRWKVLRQLKFRNRDFAFLPEILILAQQRGFSIIEHPIRFVFRERGRSKMGLVRTSVSYLRLFGQRMGPSSR